MTARMRAEIDLADGRVLGIGWEDPLTDEGWSTALLKQATRELTTAAEQAGGTQR